MKKLLTICLLLLTAPLMAQSLNNLESILTRDLIKQTKQLAWHREFKHLQKQFTQLGDRASHYDPLPVMLYSPLSHRETTHYLRRMMQLQKSVDSNPVLKGFTFVAPVPPDLAQFSDGNYAALLAFLKDLQVVKIVHMERVRPFTLAVQIHGQDQSALEVWLDVPTRKVYLMSDNFYTTAAGKYDLHLR